MACIRFAGCALALSALLAACADQTPVDPVDVADDGAPAFDYLNGPFNPGNSPVLRFQEYGYLTLLDPAEGLVVRMYDALDTWRCGGAADDPIWDSQYLDQERVKFISMTQEVPLVVYPYPNTTGKSFCDFLATEWLYVGSGTAHINDNNVFWYMGTGGNDTYGIRVNGTVEDAAGNMYMLTGNNHYTVKGLCCDPYVDPADEWMEVMSMIETISIHPIQ